MHSITKLNEKTNMIQQNKQSGFSAIEIGVVVLVVGIIGALGWKFYDSATHKATVGNVTEASAVDITPATLTDLKDIATIQETALKDKPGVTVIHVELEQAESGTLVYKAQLSDGTVTVYNARSGAHVKTTKNTEKTTEILPSTFTGGIGFTKAVEVARAEKPTSKVYKIELELEGGVVVYSVRFTDKARVDVNAADGTIVRTKAAKTESATPAATTSGTSEAKTSTSANSGSGSTTSGKSSSGDDHTDGHISGADSSSDLSDSDDDDATDSSNDSSSDDSDHSGSGKNR
jgi:uncharacterized membrane protein YkoI